MKSLTSALDPTRPVVDNDGWEHVNSDLLTIHDYASDEAILQKRYSMLEQIISARPGGRAIYAEGAAYHGEPIILSEFGGISFGEKCQGAWGYSVAKNQEDFLLRLKAVFRPIQDSPVLQGYCYTQFTDVDQETNGLLTYDRKPKVPLETIASLLSHQ